MSSVFIKILFIVIVNVYCVFFCLVALLFTVSLSLMTNVQGPKYYEPSQLSFTGFLESAYLDLDKIFAVQQQ